MEERSLQNTYMASFKNTAVVVWASWLASLFQTFRIPDSKKLVESFRDLAKHVSFDNN